MSKDSPAPMSLEQLQAYMDASPFIHSSGMQVVAADHQAETLTLTMPLKPEFEPERAGNEEKREDRGDGGHRGVRLRAERSASVGTAAADRMASRNTTCAAHFRANVRQRSRKLQSFGTTVRRVKLTKR